MHTLDGKAIEKMLAVACSRIHEKKDWLSELDAACGDGDHGVSVARGFLAVEEQLSSWRGLAPGVMIRKAGMVLVSSIGGAAGPLLGTLFIEAGKAIGEQKSVSTADLAAMFDAGLAGICKRGGAKAGDKTLVDALIPAVHALKNAAENELTPSEALGSAATAARAGAEATTQMLARQGRSRYLGERALGHPDAGAYTVVVLFEALAEGANRVASRTMMSKESKKHGDEEANQQSGQS
jgi:dihydroxyacetone kinase-like protein